MSCSINKIHMKNINVFKIYSARLQTLATSAARGPPKMGHDKNKLAPARFKNKLTAARFRIAQYWSFLNLAAVSLFLNLAAVSLFWCLHPFLGSTFHRHFLNVVFRVNQEAFDYFYYFLLLIL
jgi:hypothetical protein